MSISSASWRGDGTRLLRAHFPPTRGPGSDSGRLGRWQLRQRHVGGREGGPGAAGGPALRGDSARLCPQLHVRSLLPPEWEGVREVVNTAVGPPPQPHTCPGPSSRLKACPALAPPRGCCGYATGSPLRSDSRDSGRDQGPCKLCTPSPQPGLHPRFPSACFLGLLFRPVLLTGDRVICSPLRGSSSHLYIYLFFIFIFVFHSLSRASSLPHPPPAFWPIGGCNTSLYFYFFNLLGDIG